jgi:hypothetical protein
VAFSVRSAFQQRRQVARDWFAGALAMRDGGYAAGYRDGNGA